MDARGLSAYRTIVREVNRASILTRQARSKTITASFRTIFEERRDCDSLQHFDHDNVMTFMRSQRMYKTLLERYNPLHDLTTEERVQATARRVGLDMPVTPNGEEDK
ncbi:hypothetical protein AcV5_000931 [Taiwanofungus camphoratus]|nr:hypothetical protein AcV5_000931 [Antrodia cinnamomea]